MRGTTVEAPSLTSEQRAVVEQPWDARVLVTAGAGAGKTWTLVRRLDTLMGDESGALEAAEILVLTFSRAAVRELRERLFTHGGAARRVRAQTFDSWARSLLATSAPEGEWERLSFDERIREAVRAVERGVVEALEHGPPSHVVIDEVQDLVGDRRNLVETLLDRFQDSCGFTVVGDGAQAVYGFQVSDPVARAAETNYFFDWLRASYPDDLVQLRLTENFRARTEDARTALSLGSALAHLSSDMEQSGAAATKIYSELRERLLSLPDPGDLSSPFVVDSLRDYQGTCAVLCRDNRQALVLSETLFQHHVPHRLQQSSRERPAPAWIARLVRWSGSPTLSETRFREALSAGPRPPAVDPAVLWRSLRGAARGAGGHVDVRALRRLVAEQRLPDELTAFDPPRLMVSTVHRAKGLEFDRVFVAEPSTLEEIGRQHGELDPAAEARALYVAMTRAREDLYRTPAPATFPLRRHRPTGRWYVGGRKSYMRLGLEVSAQDVCGEHPPGAGAGPENDPSVLQEYLANVPTDGDPLELRLQHSMPAGADQSPPYTVYHDGTPVGVVSEEFRRALHACLRISPAWQINAWPVRVTGLRVSAVETVAGSLASGVRAGLGEHGMWLVPRMCGIGRFHWKDEDQKGFPA